MAVGGGSSASGLINGAPYMIQSLDSGAVWEEVTIDNITNNGNFTSVSCAGSSTITCVTVGFDENNGQSLIAQTINSGTDWFEVTATSTPGFTPISAAELFASSCTASGSDIVCAVGGEGNVAKTASLGKATDIPLVVYNSSTDPAWTQITANLPASGQINSISCSDTTPAPQCTAVGGNQSDSGSITSILLQSLNSEGTWSSPSVSGLPANGNFDSVSCNTQLCVASGASYDVNEINTGPLLVEGLFNGSWEWTTVTLGGFTHQAELFTSFCAPPISPSFCGSVGIDYTTGSPLLLVNAAVGPGAWAGKSFPLSSTASLVSSSCVEGFCVAAGG